MSEESIIKWSIIIICALIALTVIITRVTPAGHRLRKIVKRGAIVLCALAALTIIVGNIILRVTPVESRLREVSGCDEILLREGNFAVMRSNDGESLCFAGVWQRHFLGVPIATKKYAYAEFDLSTHEVSNETYAVYVGSEWENTFAEQARRELYAYSIWWEVENDAPKSTFYIGMSETEPTYELLGDGISDLRCVELDGLYAFIFTQDSSSGV